MLTYAAIAMLLAAAALRTRIGRLYLALRLLRLTTGATIQSKLSFDDYRLAIGQAGGAAGAQPRSAQA